MKLTLVQRTPQTHDTESFCFKPEEPVDYQPGQFFKWTLQHPNPDDRGVNRFFTISSSPTEEFICLTTKFNAERSSSFKSALKALRPDETIEAVRPSGSFVLPEEQDQPVVFVAGGIGITPFRSMLKFLHDGHISRPIELLYGVRSDQDITFKDELDEWSKADAALKISYIIGEPLSGDKIYELVPDAKTKLVYLSGPEPMIEALEQQLLAAGQPEELIKTDYFPNYTAI